jgi:hypothetical protein
MGNHGSTTLGNRDTINHARFRTLRGPVSTNSKPLRGLFWNTWLTVIVAVMPGAATVAQCAHLRAVQNQIARVLNLVQHVETSQRGYLLTGRAIYLDAYEDAETALLRPVRHGDGAAALSSPERPSYASPRPPRGASESL